MTRILFGYRYGIIGGVCTQLASRMQSLSRMPDVEVEFAFGGDYGAGAMLAPFGRVHVVPEAAARRALLHDPRFDVLAIIDTPEMIRDAQGAPGRLVVEVHTTVKRNLAYVEDPALRATRYLVPSRYSKHLVETRGVPADRITIVPNVVDGDRFRPVALTPPQHPVVSWVGKLDDHKRWPDFLEVGATVCGHRPDARLWMLGGETAPEVTAELLFEAAGTAGVVDRLRWFGRVDYGAMPRVHSAVARSGGVTVVTSIDESFGMSVAEALLSGCPAVLPAVGALPELAPGAPYARLYRPGDLEQAADAAAALLGPDGPAARAALAADRATLAERWSPDTVGPQLMAALDARA